MTPGPRARGRWLSGAGAQASLEPDPWVDGAWVLSIGGAEQSHVDLAHPESVFYEYLRRLAHHVDLAAPTGAPLRVLHLGAGALTLARYVQTTRPGSPQVAVDSERELLAFVLDALPLPAGTGLETVHGDAREVLGTVLAGRRFDVAVVDIFTGADAPAHLTVPGFYAELRDLLDPGGVLLVNVGDDPPLRFTRGQIRALRTVFRAVSAAAPADMVDGRLPGNTILMATDAPWEPERLGALRALGPHPGVVLDGVDLDRFGQP